MPLRPCEVSLRRQPHRQCEGLSLPRFGKHGAVVVPGKRRQTGESCWIQLKIRRVQGNYPRDRCRRSLKAGSFHARATTRRIEKRWMLGSRSDRILIFLEKRCVADVTSLTCPLGKLNTGHSVPLRCINVKWREPFPESDLAGVFCHNPVWGQIPVAKNSHSPTQSTGSSFTTVATSL